MSDPCESKNEIHAIAKDVAVGNQRLTTIEQCRVADKQILDTFIGEMREASRSMERFLIEGREQLRSGDEKFQLLFQKDRDLKIMIAEVDAHGEENLQVCRNQGTVRHTEFVEKQFRPLVNSVQVLHDDKVARDTRHGLLKAGPIILGAVAVTISIWAKITALFTVKVP